MEENVAGKLLRVTIVGGLLYAAYTVAFCPCANKELLACKNHGWQFLILLVLAELGVLLHHKVGVS